MLSFSYNTFLFILLISSTSAICILRRNNLNKMVCEFNAFLILKEKDKYEYIYIYIYIFFNLKLYFFSKYLIFNTHFNFRFIY